MRDSRQFRDIMFEKGFFETTDGNYISAKMVGRINPIRSKGFAVCKDKNGNTIANIIWPKSEGGKNG